MILNALCIITLLLVVALVTAEIKLAPRARYVLKPLASIGFLATALQAGALDGASPYGLWIFAGLVLSFWGDVFLMADERPALFLAGLGSFLLGHVAYVVAFISFGVDLKLTALSGAALLPIAWFVWRWLRPHVPSDMLVPVIAYVVVICAMLAHAVGAWGAGGTILMPIGATLFWISDLAVARRQFVDPSPMNAVWGLPIYYAGQLVLAVSVTSTLPGS